MEGTFKAQTPFEERVRLAEKLLAQNRSSVPVIVECANDSALKPLAKSKFLAARHMTVGAFLNDLKQKLALGQHETLFLFCQDVIVGNVFATSLGDLYEDKKDEDGLLYIVYCSEAAFG